MNRIRALDLFCGAGGSSWGARLAGVEVVAGFDVWDAAGAAFARNFPAATFFHERLENLDPQAVRRRVGAVDLILASPECKSHSPARGAGKRSTQSKNSAFEVVRFAAAFRPRWIVIENVVGMRRWPRFRALTRALEALGYNIRQQVLNAADFGVPQKRRRLYLMCDLHSEPAAVEGNQSAHVPVSRVIDMDGTHSTSPLYSPRRASATLERAELAMAAIGENKPYLIVYYGSDKCGGWQRVTESLRTVTTLDRFALVKPRKAGHVMRMLQVPELKRAMGMPMRFSVGSGSRREQIHLIGNAVCPPVMRAIVRSLTRASAVDPSSRLTTKAKSARR